MATIGAFAAKTHLSSLLERVVQGEPHHPRHGKPVAQLVPEPQRDPGRIKAALRRMQEIDIWLINAPAAKTRRMC